MTQNTVVNAKGTTPNETLNTVKNHSAHFSDVIFSAAPLVSDTLCANSGRCGASRAPTSALVERGTVGNVDDLFDFLCFW